MSEKWKERREWLNLIFTFLGVLGIPIVLLFVHSIKTDIALEVKNDYVTREDFKEAKAKLETSDTDQRLILSTVSVKLDELRIGQAAMQQSITDLQRQVNNASHIP